MARRKRAVRTDGATPAAVLVAEPPEPPRAAPQLWIALLLIGCTVAALWPVCGNEFTTWDDAGTVWRNPTLNPPTLHSLAVWWTRPNMDLYIPVTYMTWGAVALLAQVSPEPGTGIRLNPYIFHGTNLVLHVLAVLVVYQILVGLTARRWAACAGALVFAMHPLQVEPVAWVSGTKDVLSGLLALAAVWQYLLAIEPREGREAPAEARRDATPTNPHFWLATALYLLAMLAKPAAMVVPVIAGAIDWLVLRRQAREVWRSLWPWFVLAVACAAWTKLVQPATRSAPESMLWQRPLIAADALAFYFWKLVWPASLCIDYGRRPVTVFSEHWVYLTWLAPATVAVLIWAVRRAAPMLAAAAIVFVAGVGPVLGLVRFDFQDFSTVADHYVYVSMLGVAMATACLLAKLPDRPVVNRAAAVVVAVVLLALGIRSGLQTRVWQDTDTLFRHALAVNRECAAAYNSLAAECVTRHRPADAIPLAREAVRLRPDRPNGYVTLGAALAMTGQMDEAVDAFRRGHEANPDSAMAINNLAGILGQTGHVEEALPLARRAVALQPDLADAHLNLGTLLGQEHRLPEALAELQIAVRLAPASVMAQNNLAAALVAAGLGDEAAEHYSIALQLDPGSDTARRGLARLGRQVP